MTEQFVHVWDKFVRFFHWSLVTLFILLYFSATYEHDEIHFLLSYLLTLLLFGRTAWGFTASGYARFNSFTYPLPTIIRYIKSMLSGNEARYLGHNPAGAVMIFALLSLLTIMVATGFVMLTWGEYEGPLWAIGIDFDATTAKACRLIHETTTNLLLLLIILHLAGVALASFKHRENLPLSMWNGKKRR